MHRPHDDRRAVTKNFRRGHLAAKLRGVVTDADYRVRAEPPRVRDHFVVRLLSSRFAHFSECVDATADEIRLELSAGSPAAAAVSSVSRLDGRGFGDAESAIGLEERVVRLERAMTATLDLLQQMRRSSPTRPPDQVKG